ncbi:unnamed protein product [Acanthoscelides obtectus]|uniref:Rhamnogalacturonase A/B/Epimerase-like pectate lyase domain-containing protein n=1 Tax=Acanthoscelides obtectus TaxID=200917 RepID=A0A9P0KRZ7_ACAOB|nr:unnamed protein product [Acanthoscelides obtectus]CAK1674753.1 hypothetical protein AOBTE_LOCUS29727 [Acanthoscelides obtectus]
MFRLSIAILALVAAANAAVHNVTSFGADPTGRRSSTEAIALAINAAAAENGGIVHLPAGSYSNEASPIHTTNPCHRSEERRYQRRRNSRRKRTNLVEQTPSTSN